MNIIQLLEVLKPAKDVVTVQIANEKDQWTSWFDLAKAVLPAAATAFVAWLAMNRSHRQFEITSERQAEEFAKNLGQQTRALKIQTQIATEIELKKEECRNVREACARYLSFALEASRHKSDYNIALKFIDQGKLGFNEDSSKSHFNYMEASQKTATARMMLLSFLSPATEPEFYAAIVNVDELLISDCKNFGTAVGMCLAQCRSYIEGKQAEISNIPSTITDA